MVLVETDSINRNPDKDQGMLSAFPHGAPQVHVALRGGLYVCIDARMITRKI